MKKIVLLLLVVFGVQIVANGQAFKKNDKAITLGIGIPSASLYTGSYYKLRIPPISLSYEHGITDKLGIGYIGVGGYFAIAGSKYEVTIPPFDTYGWKYTYIIVGVRGAYHFDLVDNLDIYAGLMVGARVTSSKEIGDVGVASPDKTKATHAEFAGIRWYVKPRFALMAELGYGISYINLGVAFKF